MQKERIDFNMQPLLHASTESGFHLMLAEDDPGLRFLWQLEIERWKLPLRATFVKDGWDALLAMVNDLPDLLITDVTMPHLDGHQLVSLMHHNPPYDRIPVIIVSAGPVDAFRSPAVIGWFNKPVDHKRIQEQVRQLVQQGHGPASANESQP